MTTETQDRIIRWFCHLFDAACTAVFVYGVMVLAAVFGGAP